MCIILLERAACGKPPNGYPKPHDCEIGLTARMCRCGGLPGRYGESLVPGPGLEPGYSAPKADVLPIRRSQNGWKELAQRDGTMHRQPRHKLWIQPPESDSVGRPRAQP